MSVRTDRAEEAALEKVAQIARKLAVAPTLDETLQCAVDLGSDYIDGCEGTSISFIQNRALTTPVWSSRTALAADQAQYRHNQGPCLEALSSHHTIVIDDIAEEGRWPRWREAVLDLNLRSSVSFRLFLTSEDEETYGSLNMFSSRAHAFDFHAQVLGQIFASHAAVALKAAIAEAGYEQAVRARDLIGLAKGVIMERHDVDAGEAFEMLRRIANDRNIPMRSLAEQVTESGALSD